MKDIMASAFIQISLDPQVFPPRGSIAAEQQKSKELFYICIYNNDLYYYYYLKGVANKEMPVAKMTTYLSTNYWKSQILFLYGP